MGAGDLGLRVASGLVHTHQRRSVRVIGRSEESLRDAVNLARFSAIQRGFPAEISYAIGDVRNTDQVAAAIRGYEPDVIFLALSRQPWWVVFQLPQAESEQIRRANFGPWLPMHLAPVLDAMIAIRASGSPAIVVNAAYPDAVNSILHAVNLGPHIGIGNVANNVPGVTAVAADLLSIAADQILTRLTAHHYASHNMSRISDLPDGILDISIQVGGVSVLEELPRSVLLAPLRSRYRRTGGLAGQAMTASSALSVLEPLVDRAAAHVHAPGPLGRIGGYPIRIDIDGNIHLDLSGSLSSAEAQDINLRGQRLDGIDDISGDGTVKFSADSMAVLDEAFGYNCSEMLLMDARDWADELGTRFAAYRARLD